MKSILAEPPITRDPDEPHPDNEWEWKCWWVKRFYDPEGMLTQGDMVFMHSCWIETKARWNIPDER